MTMALGLVGTKCGMMQIYTAEGEAVQVSVIAVNPNRITQIKNKETDGYCALQITAGQKSSAQLTKPMMGHFRKAGVEAGKIIREFRVSEKELEGKELGGDITIDFFKLGQTVDITGITKGKGFAGSIKRNHFAKQDVTHGNSLTTRSVGSTGQRQSPGRVFPGKKMPGHLGDVQRTIQHIQIVEIDAKRHLLLVKGGIPGAPGGMVIIVPSIKARGEV
jgi:large subunit ribosomal protein L3